VIRVVLDANVPISGLIQPRGPSGRLLKRIFARRDLALVLSPPILEEVRRILNDDKYLAAAAEGNAGFISTGDRDLLDLVEWQGVRIVPPREFLARVGNGGHA
jgi:predicted nucleic acid-binding protein